MVLLIFFQHYYLLTADVNSKTDLNSVGKLLSAKDLRFVDAKKMSEMLGVILGVLVCDGGFSFFLCARFPWGR